MTTHYSITVTFKDKTKKIFPRVKKYEWTPSGEFFFIGFFPVLIDATKKDPTGYYSTKKWIRAEDIKSMDAIENNDFDNDQERTKAIANGTIQ